MRGKSGPRLCPPNLEGTTSRAGRAERAVHESMGCVSAALVSRPALLLLRPLIFKVRVPFDSR